MDEADGLRSRHAILRFEYWSIKPDILERCGGAGLKRMAAARLGCAPRKSTSC